MPVKAVVKMGNVHLATPSQEVSDLNDPKVAAIIADMHDTMLAEEGIGIAAPQVGYNIRVIMFEVPERYRLSEAEPLPLTVLINPEIKYLTSEVVLGWEGCLSVPGMRGLVPRYTQIEYSGFNPQGQWVTCVAEGLHARVVQHEYDHLDGVLYPFRVQDLRYFGFEDEF